MITFPFLFLELNGYILLLVVFRRTIDDRAPIIMLFMFLFFLFSIPLVWLDCYDPSKQGKYDKYYTYHYLIGYFVGAISTLYAFLFLLNR